MAAAVVVAVASNQLDAYVKIGSALGDNPRAEFFIVPLALSLLGEPSIFDVIVGYLDLN